MLVELSVCLAPYLMDERRWIPLAVPATDNPEAASPACVRLESDERLVRTHALFVPGAMLLVPTWLGRDAGTALGNRLSLEVPAFGYWVEDV